MLKSDMQIKRLGNKTILLKGKKESVIINPEKVPKSDSRIIMFSESKDLTPTEGDKVVIAGAGEYEIGGVEIVGTKTEGTGLFYSIGIDGVRVGMVSNLKEELTEKKMDKVGEVDVLIFELGNEDGKLTKILLGMAKKLGANYVIPVDYTEGDESIVNFLDESDNEGEESVESLNVEKEELPDGMEVVLLKTNE